MGGEILARYKHQWRPFRGRFGAVVAVLVLALVALIAARFDPEPSQLSGQARVSDGDSFHLGDERVRLLGIDAPELDQTCADAAGRDWPCGRVARDRLAALLTSNLDCDAEGRDQYRRILAVCHVGNRDIGRIMVAEGLAISSGRYFAEGNAARMGRRGLWQGSFQSPRDWRDEASAQSDDVWGWLLDFIR